jgi:hypothetical protein
VGSVRSATKNDLLSRAFQAVTAAGAQRQEVTFVVHDDGPVGLDGVRAVFDDDRVVSDAGVVLAATLAQRLGIEDLVQRFVRLRRDRPGASVEGRVTDATRAGRRSVDLRESTRPMGEVEEARR